VNEAISPPRISATADRMRRHRQRRRDGLRCLTVELRVTEINTLVRMGLLHRDSRNDDGAVLTAFYSLLDRVLGS
jgi:gamma-glutamylcysteine synthetase